MQLEDCSSMILIHGGYPPRFIRGIPRAEQVLRQYPLALLLFDHFLISTKKSFTGSFRYWSGYHERNENPIRVFLSFDHNPLFVNETEGIFCQKIPFHSICTDPATSPAELPIGTPRTPATEPGLFFPEPQEHRIGGVSPYPAEWLVSDIPYKKMLGTGKLARIHIPV
jgi:hypothetical protein